MAKWNMPYFVTSPIAIDKNLNGDTVVEFQLYLNK